MVIIEPLATVAEFTATVELTVEIWAVGGVDDPDVPPPEDAVVAGDFCVTTVFLDVLAVCCAAIVGFPETPSWAVAPSVF